MVSGGVIPANAGGGRAALLVDGRNEVNSSRPVVVRRSPLIVSGGVIPANVGGGRGIPLVGGGSEGIVSIVDKGRGAPLISGRSG